MRQHLGLKVVGAQHEDLFMIVGVAGLLLLIFARVPIALALAISGGVGSTSPSASSASG